MKCDDQLRIVREALEFYADEDTYNEINESGFPIDADAGEKARAALEKIGDGK